MPSESQVMSQITPRRAGASFRRSIGTIGNTWSIAHTSGIDSNTLKLTKYLSTSRSLSSSSTGRWLFSSWLRRARTPCAMA